MADSLTRWAIASITLRGGVSENIAPLWNAILVAVYILLSLSITAMATSSITVWTTCNSPHAQSISGCIAPKSMPPPKFRSPPTQIQVGAHCAVENCFLDQGLDTEQSSCPDDPVRIARKFTSTSCPVSVRMSLTDMMVPTVAVGVVTPSMV